MNRNSERMAKKLLIIVTAITTIPGAMLPA